MLCHVQRRIALRVVSAYRNVPADAIQVIASIPPLELQALGRKELYDRQSDWEQAQIREQIRNTSNQQWQERWERSNKGGWTFRLIPNIKKWFRRTYGQVDFHTTQALTGHGCISDNLRRFGKLPTAECMCCRAPQNDAYHTFFVYDAWHASRRRVEVAMGKELVPEAMVDGMLESPDKWTAVTQFFIHILSSVRKKKAA